MNNLKIIDKRVAMGWKEKKRSPTHAEHKNSISALINNKMRRIWIKRYLYIFILISMCPLDPCAPRNAWVSFLFENRSFTQSMSDHNNIVNHNKHPPNSSIDWTKNVSVLQWYLLSVKHTIIEHGKRVIAVMANNDPMWSVAYGQPNHTYICSSTNTQREAFSFTRKFNNFFYFLRFLFRFIFPAIVAVVFFVIAITVELILTSHRMFGSRLLMSHGPINTAAFRATWNGIWGRQTFYVPSQNANRLNRIRWTKVAFMRTMSLLFLLSD